VALIIVVNAHLPRLTADFAVLDIVLLRAAPWVSLFPGLAIGVVVLGVNLLGDGLQDALDPRALRARIS